MQFSLDMKDWLLQVDFSDERDFTVFIWEKERSTEAVPTGMVRQTLARMLKFGNMVCIMELVDNSFNCSLISSLG